MSGTRRWSTRAAQLAAAGEDVVFCHGFPGAFDVADAVTADIAWVRDHRTEFSLGGDEA